MKKKGTSGGGWKWLALAGLGVAAAYAASRLLEADDGPRRLPPPEPPGEEPDPAVDPLVLPEGVALSHVAGPAGTLRVAEKNPDAPLALVFVHGLGGRLEHWAPVFHRLGPGLRGIAFDLPGHGESEIPRDGDFGVPALASAIGAVAAALGLRRFVLIGHSLGGLLAIDYAGRHPERVGGLLLVDSNGDATQLPAEERESVARAVAEDPHGELQFHWRQILLDADPDVAIQVFDDLAATAPETLAGALAGGLDYSPLAAFDRYTGPAEALVTPANSMPFSLHRLRPNLPVKTLIDSGHWLMMDRPQEFCDVLWDFLGRVRR